jgi:hypothetical protein
MKSDLPTKDVYSVLWPLHLMSRIFGLAPYPIKLENKSLENGYITKYFGRIWSVFWLIFLVVLQYINVTINIIENVTLQQKILEVLFSVSTYTYSICSLLLPLTINRDKVPQIIAKLSEIDRLFSTKKYRSQIYENTRLFIIIQITVLISTLLVLFFCGAYIIHGNFSFTNFNYFFFAVFPVILNCIVILHFVNLVLLLRDKYKCLNSTLEKSSDIISKVTDLNDFHTNFITPIENSAFEMNYFNREKRELNISSRRKQLHNLRIIYSQLYNVAVLINSTYGISLLCATVWVFIGIISGVNYMIKINHTEAGYYIIVAVLWSIFCATLMTIMAVSCSLAVNECNRSAVIVQNIMLRDDIETEITKELKKMFSQFKFMKIEFSACGMYKIDLSFLCGIFGATLSYLIIIFQL